MSIYAPIGDNLLNALDSAVRAARLHSSKLAPADSGRLLNITKHEFGNTYDRQRACSLLSQAVDTNPTKYSAFDYKVFVTNLIPVLKDSSAPCAVIGEVFNFFREMAYNANKLKDVTDTCDLLMTQEVPQLAKEWLERIKDTQGSRSSYFEGKAWEQMLTCILYLQTKGKEENFLKVPEIVYKEEFQSKEAITAHNYATTGYYGTNFHLWEKVANFEKGHEGKSYKVQLLAVSGVNLASKDDNGLSDPFFRIYVKEGDKYNKLLTSSVQKKTLNPSWKMNEEKTSSFSIKHGEKAIFQIYDKDLIGTDFMGSLHFVPSEFYAIQQAGKDTPTDSITITTYVASNETTSKDKKRKYHSVSGHMIIKMNIIVE